MDVRYQPSDGDFPHGSRLRVHARLGVKPSVTSQLSEKYAHTRVGVIGPNLMGRARFERWASAK